MKFHNYLLICSLLFSIHWCSAQIQWSDPIDIASSEFGNFYPRIQVDQQGDVFVSWGGVNSVYFAKSSGQGFSDPVKINNDSTKAYVASWTGADLAVQGDKVYIGFMHKDWGKKSYLVRSDDGGLSFYDPMLIENYQDSASRFPTVAIDANGNPMVAIMKMTLNGQHPHYVIRKSDDQGESFSSEFSTSDFAGMDSEACDCCPAAMINDGMHVNLLFRNNANNIREIWTLNSTDGGISFESGNKVDTSAWQIFSCPASGPDGIIVEDFLFSTYMSNSKCYLSKTDLNSNEILSIEPLGELPTQGSQNFPRIAKHGYQCGITWKSLNFGQRLMLSYTNDINTNSFIQDTIEGISFQSSDIAIFEDQIHLIWEDNSTGTVRYMTGNTQVSSNNNIVQSEPLLLRPNPAEEFIYVSSMESYKTFKIFDINGRQLQQGAAAKTINVQSLNAGIYLLQLDNRKVARFIKR